MQYESYEPHKYYYVTSIDIGVKNFGISLTSINQNFTFKEVIWFDLIDITTFVHLNDKAVQDCELYHEKTFCDYLEHVFYLNAKLFEISNWILLERQPLNGYVVVEQLIFSKFRNKAVLVSPNSMHSYFGWTKLKLNYEQRKQKSIFIAKKYLHRSYLLSFFNSLERQHDIADCICIMLFWIFKKHSQWIEEQRIIKINEKIKEHKLNGKCYRHLTFEKFKFIDKRNEYHS